MDKDEKNIVIRDCDQNVLSQNWKIEEVKISGFPFHALWNMGKKKYLSIASDKPDWNAKLNFSVKIDKFGGTQLWSIRDKE